MVDNHTWEWIVQVTDGHKMIKRYCLARHINRLVNRGVVLTKEVCGWHKNIIGWTPDSRKVTNVHKTNITDHFIQRSVWAPFTYVYARLHP